MNALGVPSHVFRGSPAEVAESVRRHALTCVQLTPNFPRLAFRDPGQITPVRCRQAAEPFLAAGIRIAALSGNTNLMDPDLDRRHRGIVRLHALIRRCRDFGTTRIVTETGSLSPSSPWAPYPPNRLPEAWQELRLIVREALRFAAGQDVVLLLKPECTHVLASIGDMVRLREELCHPNLGFVLDPAGLLLERERADWSTNLQQLFEQLGPCSHLMHAKDLRTDGRRVTMPRAGRGTLDYRLIGQLLRSCRHRMPIIMEHVRPEEVEETRTYLEGALGSA